MGKRWSRVTSRKPGELMRFLKIQAVLDYSELEPGLKASNAIRRAAEDLNLASGYQARVRLTGPGPNERRPVRHHQGERRA